MHEKEFKEMDNIFPFIKTSLLIRVISTFFHKTNLLLIEEKYGACQHKDMLHCYVYVLRISPITEHARYFVALDSQSERWGE
jgi:hypothetical protein